MAGEMPVDLGYHFHTPEEATGNARCLHPQLDVLMHAEPTGRHFDPQILTVTAVVGGYTQKISFHHPAPDGRTFQIAAGRIVLRDRVQKEVEAFTFGGELQAHLQNGTSLFQLRSPAPILAVVRLGSPIILFVSEVEILLSRIKVRLDGANGLGFEARMARVAPLTLYVACVETLTAVVPRNTRQQLGQLLPDLLHDVEQRTGKSAVAVDNRLELLLASLA